MRVSSTHAAHPRQSMLTWRPLAVAVLLLGFAASSGSAWGFKPSAPCPQEDFRTWKPRPLKWTACPDSCKCSSTDAELWCHRTDLPHFADADAKYVEVMAVQGVEISPLEAHHFSGLENLQSLTLRNGRISEVAEDAFQDLSFLRHLDLSHNEIVGIPMDTFFYNKNLRFLVLDGNPLHVPSSGPWLRSASLGSLSIRGCGLTSMKSQTFVGVPDLYEILMEDNPLTEFPSDAVSHLKRLCSIGVDVVIEDAVTRGVDPHVAVDAPSGFDVTQSDVRQILITIVVASFTVLVLIGAYKFCTTFVCRRKQEVGVREPHPSRSNNENNNGWTEEPGPLHKEVAVCHRDDRRGSYCVVPQMELLPVSQKYPGYVYNGVHFPGERFPYTDNGLYSPATICRHLSPRPPLPCDTIGRAPKSIASSTSDLRTSAIYDNENTCNCALGSRIQNTQSENTTEMSREPPDFRH